MEHEVFVPVAAERLRQAFGDPSVLARALPGLQRDADDEHPLAGRLKVRVGGSSVTYRGSARVTAQDDGSHLVEADAVEARGSGAVEVALTVRMREESDGTTLLFTGTVGAEGRIKEFAPDTVHAAGVRLLNRFAGELGEVAGPAEPGREGGPPDVPGTGEPLAGQEFEPLGTGDFEAAPDADDVPVPPVPQVPAAPAEQPEPPRDESPDAAAGESSDAAADESLAIPPATPAPTTPPTPSVFDAEIPPPSLDPDQDDDFDQDDQGEDDEHDGGHEGNGGNEDDEPEGNVPSAEPGIPEDDDTVGVGGGGPEAAHARRTMIGRSAEEVDHAPPRGRYAPVPPPEATTVNIALRWAAPAAALALASAVVVTRVLRRRR